MIDTTTLHWTLSNGIQTYDVNGFSMTNEYGCDTTVEGTFSGNVTNATMTIDNKSLNDYFNELCPSMTTATCIIGDNYPNTITSTGITINDSGCLVYNGTTDWNYNYN